MPYSDGVLEAPCAILTAEASHEDLLQMGLIYSTTMGISGLTARNAAGIQVTPIGEKEDADEFIHRIKWYCGFALFSEKGLAAAPGITG